jgi:hypothetical protein
MLFTRHLFSTVWAEIVHRSLINQWLIAIHVCRNDLYVQSIAHFPRLHEVRYFKEPTKPASRTDPDPLVAAWNDNFNRDKFRPEAKQPSFTDNAAGEWKSRKIRAAKKLK